MVQHLFGSTTITMLSPIFSYGGTSLPNSRFSDAHARAAVPYQAFRYSITYLLRSRSEEALWRNRLEIFRYSIACISRWLPREAPGQNCLKGFCYNIAYFSR